MELNHESYIRNVKNGYTGTQRILLCRNALKAGLSIGFEVDGDILKVDSYGGPEGPHTSEGSGGG